MVDTITNDVHPAKDVKRFASNVDIAYDSDSFRKLIFNTDDDDFLLVKKRIGSKITIMDVKVVNDDLINGMI